MGIKIITIYKITSPTNKIYIGQTRDYKRRCYAYRGDGPKSQKKLYFSLKKYGLENHKFEIVHELPSDVSQEILDNYEILYFNQYRSCGFEMMNLKECGKSGKHSLETIQKFRNFRHNEESKKKMSIKKIGSKNAKGSIRSQKQKDFLQKINLGNKNASGPRTEEFKIEQSKRLKIIWEKKRKEKT